MSALKGAAFPCTCFHGSSLAGWSVAARAPGKALIFWANTLTLLTSQIMAPEGHIQDLTDTTRVPGQIQYRAYCGICPGLHQAQSGCHLGPVRDLSGVPLAREGPTIPMVPRTNPLRGLAGLVIWDRHVVIVGKLAISRWLLEHMSYVHARLYM